MNKIKQSPTCKTPTHTGLHTCEKQSGSEALALYEGLKALHSLRLADFQSDAAYSLILPLAKEQLTNWILLGLQIVVIYFKCLVSWSITSINTVDLKVVLLHKASCLCWWTQTLRISTHHGYAIFSHERPPRPGQDGRPRGFLNLHDAAHMQSGARFNSFCRCSEIFFTVHQSNSPNSCASCASMNIYICRVHTSCFVDDTRTFKYSRLHPHVLHHPARLPHITLGMWLGPLVQ